MCIRNCNNRNWKEYGPAFLSIAMINNMTNSNLGFCIPNDNLSLTEIRTGPKIRTEAEGMEKDAYWLAPCGMLACFFIPLRNTCPEMAPYTVGCAFVHQPLVKKMPHKCNYRQSDGGNPLIKDPSSQMTNLCQDRKKHLSCRLVTVANCLQCAKFYIG